MQIRSESRIIRYAWNDRSRVFVKNDTIYTASNVILYLYSARKFLILYDS